MPPCELNYIPDKLHTNEKPTLPLFYVGECMYLRCKSEVRDNPYKGMSITELSHNRSGIENELSEPDDVLYSIKAEEDFEKYLDKVVCTLEIKDLTPEGEYHKTFTQSRGGRDVTATIKLIHEPEPCMYPHCVFRVWLEGVVVTYENYNDTLKRTNEIRNRLKAELAGMIVTNEIRQNDIANI